VRRHKVARLDAETHPVHRVTDENDLLQAEGSDDLLKVFDEVIDCEVTSRPLALPMPVKIKQVDIACAEQSRRRECRDPECGSPGEASTTVQMVWKQPPNKQSWPTLRDHAWRQLAEEQKLHIPWSSIRYSTSWKAGKTPCGPRGTPRSAPRTWLMLARSGENMAVSLHPQMFK
jgi:hypothetical protein